MNAVLRQLLIPGARTIAYDSFTRPDSAVATGDAESGQTWTALSGTWGIASGKAYSVSNAPGNLVVVETGLADHAVSSAVNGTLNGANYGLPDVAFRVLDTNNHLFAEMYSSTLRLYKVDGGVTSLLTSTPTATLDATDYTIKVVAYRMTILVYKNGALVLQYTLSGTDTKYTAYTKAGLRLLRNNVPATPPRWDEFLVESVQL